MCKVGKVENDAVERHQKVLWRGEPGRLSGERARSLHEELSTCTAGGLRGLRGAGEAVLTCCVPLVAPGSLTSSVPRAELSPEPHVLWGPQESGFSLGEA